VVSQLAASGLFRINSVSFHVERERQALNDARREAMRDAREQAEVYADAGRFRLIGISAITDGEAAPTEIGQADLPPNWTVQIIPPAVVTFSASVNVTWRIAPAER
jgi:uncharacterized protein YggE